MKYYRALGQKLSLSLHNTNAETNPPRSGWSDLPLPLTQNIYMCNWVGACSMESFTSFLKVHQTRSMESCTSVLEVHPVITMTVILPCRSDILFFSPGVSAKQKLKNTHTYIHTEKTPSLLNLHMTFKSQLSKPIYNGIISLSLLDYSNFSTIC